MVLLARQESPSARFHEIHYLPCQTWISNTSKTAIALISLFIFARQSVRTFRRKAPRSTVVARSHQVNKGSPLIIGTGSAIPSQNLSNTELAKFLDTSDNWIAQRTGIKNRGILPSYDGETLSDLSAKALNQALQRSGVDPLELDLVILACSTPDELFGSAPSLCHAVGAVNAVGFDITAACSGFVFAMVTAQQYMIANPKKFRKIAIVGADALTQWVDWTDRGSCILFGDGAGAVILDSSQVHKMGKYVLGTNGSLGSSLTLASQNAIQTLPSGHNVYVGKYNLMNIDGSDVYRFAVNIVPNVVQELCVESGISVNDLDWLVLHQANLRIMEAAADRLNMSRSKVLSVLEDTGNISAGTIPLCIDLHNQQNQFKSGDKIALVGFGAGLSWGGMLMEW